ncbi:MAG: AbrB family transcriptional regulator [Bacillota bacterium]
MGYLALTLIIAAVGGLIALKLRIPAGALVGSMILVAIVQSSGVPMGSLPSCTRIVIQILLGTMLGLSLTPEALHELKQIALPAIVLVATLVTTGIITGLVISKISKLDVITSLFSTAPGGMTDMVLLSSVLGADAPKVAALHLIRIVGVLLVMPPLLRWLVK